MDSINELTGQDADRLDLAEICCHLSTATLNSSPSDQSWNETVSTIA